MTATTVERDLTIGDIATVLDLTRTYVARRVADFGHLLSRPFDHPGSGRRRIYRPVDAVVLAMALDTADCTTAREQLARTIHATHSRGVRPEVITAAVAARTLVTYQPRWGLLDHFTEDPT
jgi:hypothetical protein